MLAPSIQEHWTYLNRLRQTDEFSTVVARTLLNTENQLGVVFYASVSDDKIPEQIDQIMTKMAKHFPKDSVTVVAYGRRNDLHPVKVSWLWLRAVMP